MDKPSQIARLIKSIAGKSELSDCFLVMEVTKVENAICNAKIGDLELSGIRLSVIGGESEKGLLIVPKMGSMILVADLSGGAKRELVVIGVSEVESVKVQVEDFKVFIDKEKIEVNDGEVIKISKEKIELNGGKNKGLVQLEELKDNLKKLKDYIDNMQTLCSTAIKGCSPTGPAAAAAFDAGWTPIKSALLLKDMENKKITH